VESVPLEPHEIGGCYERAKPIDENLLDPALFCGGRCTRTDLHHAGEFQRKQRLQANVWDPCPGLRRQLLRYDFSRWGGRPQQNGGAVFKITPEGSLTGLHSFGSPEGNPGGGVVLAADGSFYGAAANEGGASCGLLYNISPGGTFTPLHSFDMTDGCNPYATPVQATDGNLYGTTRAGGANGYGTVFAMTPGGTLTTLHSFDLSDGNAPYGALLQAKNGDLYGTTNLGGSNGYGTIFWRVR